MHKEFRGLTLDQIIDLIYTWHLQNTNGRESHDEMFRKGIEAACYEFLDDEMLTNGELLLKDLLQKHQEIISDPKRFNGVSINDIINVFEKFGIKYKIPF
jgi:hypothetical protein